MTEISDDRGVDLWSWLRALQGTVTGFWPVVLQKYCTISNLPWILVSLPSNLTISYCKMENKGISRKITFCVFLFVSHLLQARTSRLSGICLNKSFPSSLWNASLAWNKTKWEILHVNMQLGDQTIRPVCWGACYATTRFKEIELKVRRTGLKRIMPTHPLRLFRDEPKDLRKIKWWFLHHTSSLRPSRDQPLFRFSSCYKTSMFCFFFFFLSFLPCPTFLTLGRILRRFQS